LNGSKNNFALLASEKNVRLNHQQIKGGKNSCVFKKPQVDKLKRPWSFNKTLSNPNSSSCNTWESKIKHLKTGSKKVYHHHVKLIIIPALNEVGTHLQKGSCRIIKTRR